VWDFLGIFTLRTWDTEVSRNRALYTPPSPCLSYHRILTSLFYVHYIITALPFLHNTEVFLFPLAVVVFIFVLNLIGYPLGFGWNASRIMAHLYFERV
jgi:hypothetical protein